MPEKEVFPTPWKQEASSMCNKKRTSQAINSTNYTLTHPFTKVKQLPLTHCLKNSKCAPNQYSITWPRTKSWTNVRFKGLTELPKQHFLIKISFLFYNVSFAVTFSRKDSDFKEEKALFICLHNKLQMGYILKITFYYQAQYRTKLPINEQNVGLHSNN